MLLGKGRYGSGGGTCLWAAPALALLVAVTASCGGPVADETEEQLIMALQDTEVTLRDFHQWVERNVPSTPYVQLSAEARSRLLDQMMEEKILLHAARSRGVLVRDMEVEAYLQEWGGGREIQDAALRQEVKERLTIKRFREEHLLKDLSVSEEEVRAWYDEHPERYREPDHYLIRHLFLDSEEAIRAARQRLEEGEDFSLLASGVNRNPLGDRVRRVQVGDLPPALAEALRNLEPGETSPILQTPEGFHILHLEGMEEAGVQPFEQVRDQAQTDLLRALSSRKIEETLQEMTGRQPFLFMPENLDFKYVL